MYQELYEMSYPFSMLSCANLIFSSSNFNSLFNAIVRIEVAFKDNGLDRSFPVFS